LWPTDNLFPQLVFLNMSFCFSELLSRKKRGSCNNRGWLNQMFVFALCHSSWPQQVLGNLLCNLQIQFYFAQRNNFNKYITREEETTSRCFSSSSFLVLNFTFLYPRGKFNIRDSKLASCLIPVGLHILHLDCVSLSTMPYIVFQIIVWILVFFFNILK
jgi:hypothetical protein